MDESGDLGWKLDHQYRQGGSSKYLTIAALVVDPSVRHKPKRVIQKLYKKYKWPSNVEKKWSDLAKTERLDFAQKAKTIHSENPGKIRYISITVRKENVQSHIRQDENKLYNYMICCALLNEMSKHETVNFYPDPRAIKVESGNSLHDNLQTELWFTKQVSTILRTNSIDSSSSRNIQYADMLAGIVQGHFEDANSEPWGAIRSAISYKTLFF